MHIISESVPMLFTQNCIN